MEGILADVEPEELRDHRNTFRPDQPCKPSPGITCSIHRGQGAGLAHLEAELALVVSSLDPAGITRGETETEQGFREEVTGVTVVPPWKDKET